MRCKTGPDHGYQRHPGNVIADSSTYADTPPQNGHFRRVVILKKKSAEATLKESAESRIFPDTPATFPCSSVGRAGGC